jgi:branched-chain amino acid transport system permease protein
VKAAALGVNVRKQRLVAQLIAGFVAGVAGVLGLMHYGVVSPASTGLNEILKVIMASIVGGALWLEGGIIGGAIVIYLISIVSGFTERYWFIVGTVFALVVIFMPDGLIGWIRTILGRFQGDDNLKAPNYLKRWMGTASKKGSQ